MTETKNRERQFVEIRHDLEQLVKYYPDYIATTVYEAGRPKVIVIAKDKESLVSACTEIL